MLKKMENHEKQGKCIKKSNDVEMSSTAVANEIAKDWGQSN